MSREELDDEFLGNEWEIGYSYGTQGLGMTEAMILTANALERALAARESLKFGKGWKAGVGDRAAWYADMEAMGSPFDQPIEIPY